MELTEQNFKDRMFYLAEVYKQDKSKWNDLSARLKEKGVEYCLVLPLFEVVLGFDPITDIRMEHGSEKYSNQRFDFVITPQNENHYSLIVEAKSLSETNLQKHEEQIVKYMRDNQEFPWGILTNGFEWRLYISKKYIEIKFNDSIPLQHFKNKNVFNIVTFSLKNENFIEIMQSMKKDSFSDFWFNISRYAYATISGGRGKRPVITPNKQINELLTDKVRDAVEIKTGEYWKSIQQGKMKAGDKVSCKNNFIDINFQLDSGGRLILLPKKANTHDYLAFTKNCGPEGLNILEAWRGSTNTFTDSSQVILLLTGKKKCTQKLKDLFPFNPEPLS